MRLVLAAIALGCSGPAPGLVATARLDREVFATEVLPILVEGCANPSCHGRPERGLSLYAPRRFREDPARTHLDEPLTAEELEHNFYATTALVDAADPDGSLLLAKALGARVYHGGGAVLESVNDARYRAIRAWVTR